MDIERLRALEKEMREYANEPVGLPRTPADALIDGWADRLTPLIAELGQEVGAVYAHPVELEAARRNYARGLADGLLTVSVQPIPGFVPLYNSSATPTAAADELAALLTTRQEVAPVACRGYAKLGIGAYLIEHSAESEPAALMLCVASDEEKAGRTVGDLKTFEGERQPIPAEKMTIRIDFANVAGLDALEQQLRILREVHFPTSPAHTSEARDAAIVDELVQASRALQMAKALTSLPLKNEFAKRNGMASHYEVEAWMLNAHRRFDAALAAMRQEGGTP